MQLAERFVWDVERVQRGGVKVYRYERRKDPRYAKMLLCLCPIVPLFLAVIIACPVFYLMPKPQPAVLKPLPADFKPIVPIEKRRHRERWEAPTYLMPKQDH